MSKKATLNIKQKTKRNNNLVDGWSAVHFVTSAVLCVVIGPIPALLVTIAWEPLELFVLSPILARWNILFGHETLRNSLSDIAFNACGVLVAYSVLVLVS